LPRFSPDPFTSLRQLTLSSISSRARPASPEHPQAHPLRTRGPRRKMGSQRPDRKTGSQARPTRLPSSGAARGDLPALGMRVDGSTETDLEAGGKTLREFTGCEGAWDDEQAAVETSSFADVTDRHTNSLPDACLPISRRGLGTAFPASSDLARAHCCRNSWQFADKAAVSAHADLHQPRQPKIQTLHHGRKRTETSGNQDRSTQRMFSTFSGTGRERERAQL